MSARLMSGGPMSASDLAAVLGVDRTTVVRKLRGIGASVASFGAARRVRYALWREVRGAGCAWPVYWIDESGQARQWGGLEAFHGAWRFFWTNGRPVWAGWFSDRDGICEGFPFFLGDLRPQGFLGRQIARQIARRIGTPEDSRLWSDDDTLAYLGVFGDDLPGALAVGDESLRCALANKAHPDPEGAVPVGEAPVRYPELARQAMSSPPPGSSAGGEQPKFLASVLLPGNACRHVLVKFSPPLGQDAGRRWADLLLAEFHALSILAERGLALGGHRLLDAGGRRFLELPRFDRTECGGRRGVVSLEALHAALIGTVPGDWPACLEELESEGLCSAEDVEQCRRLQAFGEMIGNTDMHAGNLAFLMDDGLPFRLAPAYDMLPMLWAPGPQGEVGQAHFASAPPVPRAAAAWGEMHGLALEFWSRLADDPRLSPEFASVARQARETVKKVPT